MEQTPRSSVLPTDPFDLALSGLLGHPDGAHTQPAVMQHVDHYGNVTTYVVQTVRWAEGNTVFVTSVNSSDGPPKRYILPPKVLALMQRQQDAVSTQVRRRQGKRLAEQRTANGQPPPTFTPAMRAKA
jgi:hypothetical protein